MERRPERGELGQEREKIGQKRGADPRRQPDKGGRPRTKGLRRKAGQQEKRNRGPRRRR